MTASPRLILAWLRLAMLSRLFYTEGENKPPLAALASRKRASQQHACENRPGGKKARISIRVALSKVVEPTEENKSPHMNVVGSVQESDVDHWKRHSTQLAAIQCCRCNFIRHKADLQREHPWLKARHAFMGGRWRLGCDVCHWMSS